jgi:mycoredoxin-dependent peroxiredoxin
MTVELGLQAPDFELRDQHGAHISLSDFRGSKAVVLMFYPYAFSGVCTGELAEVRDNVALFESDDVQLLAISCDPVYALRAFADRDGLTFPLLSDFWPHGAVSNSYGVFDAERGCSLRSTFVVDPVGILRWSVHNPMREARNLAECTRVLAGIVR